ncbi:MAG: hypothetical protein AB1762_06920, partial [Gemmatimonadota bacterium]
MRNVVPLVVGVGAVLLTAAAPNVELREAYSAIARLEARIAKLEAASMQGQTVRAPFLVVDRDGSPILSVMASDSTRRLWFGDEDRGGSVELTLSSDRGGVVVVRDATNAVRAAMIASKNFGQFRATSGSHAAYLTAEEKADGAVLSLVAGTVPSARLRSGLEGHGSLILSDKTGTQLVRAGVLK